MSEIRRGENGFVGYEYRNVTVKSSMEAVYADGYGNFGWVLEGASAPVGGVGQVTLKMKRDRKIPNKTELIRLQSQFESNASEIEALEFSKVKGAATAAYAIGLVGTAFMAGSVFAYLAGLLPLSIVLAIPGFLGWVIPYFMYLKMRGKKTDQVAPLIDQKYDEIYKVCRKAADLLGQ